MLGYARALNLALRYYGIPCCGIYGVTYDNGVFSPNGYLWSAVQLDGEWYERMWPGTILLAWSLMYWTDGLIISHT